LLATVRFIKHRRLDESDPCRARSGRARAGVGVLNASANCDSSRAASFLTGDIVA
jgi:hypothetical protein